MTAPLRVAIIGCGGIGGHHAAVLSAHPLFAVTMLVDTRHEAAKALADAVEFEHGAPLPAVVDLGSVLSPGALVDLVVVCTPSGTHIDIASESIAAGLHTVLEKPLDVDLAKAREFAAFAADASARGIHVSVISQHRFDPASVAISQALADGRFGRITSAVASVAWWRSQEYYDGGEWRGTWALDGGGAVMNQGVHTIDLLRWFLGRPVEIQAQVALLAHDRLEVEDTAVATVRFDSGALAVVHATTAAFPGLAARIQVHGTEGSAVIDNDRLEYFHAASDTDLASDTDRTAVGAGGITGGEVSGNTALDEVDFAETTAAPRLDDAFLLGHSRQYDSIARSVDTGEVGSVGVGEAFLSLALVRAIYLSSTLCTRIIFDDVVAGLYDTATVASGAQS